VLIPDPVWPQMLSSSAAGAVPARVLHEHLGWRLTRRAGVARHAEDARHLRELAGNPVGGVSRAATERIAALAREHDQ
jgi:aspartate/methionine/tyrosine aminotransferase